MKLIRPLLYELLSLKLDVPVFALALLMCLYMVLYINRENINYENIQNATYIKVKLGIKALRALRTREVLDALMYHLVFVEIGLLSKCLSAVFILALVWSLFCVGTQMIKEIVPSAEYLPTVGFCAAKKAYEPRGLGVDILKYLELRRLWHMLIDTDFVQVIVLSILDDEIYISGLLQKLLFRRRHERAQVKIMIPLQVSPAEYFAPLLDR